MRRLFSLVWGWRDVGAGLAVVLVFGKGMSDQESSE